MSNMQVTLRDRFAMKALRIRNLTNLLPTGASPQQIAQFVYRIADQMLAIRRKEKEETITEHLEGKE